MTASGTKREGSGFKMEDLVKKLLAKIKFVKVSVGLPTFSKKVKKEAENKNIRMKRKKEQIYGKR